MKPWTYPREARVLAQLTVETAAFEAVLKSLGNVPIAQSGSENEDLALCETFSVNLLAPELLFF